MSTQGVIAIRILDLPGASGACACSDLSLTPEYAAMIKEKVAQLKAALEENFPGKTSLEYTDLRQDAAAKSGKLGQLLVSKEYPTPLVVIAEEPKFAGSILIKKILKEVGNIVASGETKGEDK